MKRVLKLSLAATLFGQMAFAQSPPPATAPGGQAPAGLPQPDVNLAAPARPSLSGAEMTAQAQEYRARINETISRLGALSEQARKDKDVIRLNCLQDKLAQARANATVADQAIASLQDAVARNDDAAALHEFTRATIVNQKVQLVSAEAEACIGEDLTFIGQTRVDVTVSGDLPDDGIVNPPLPTNTFDRPPPASPYL